jgi:SAM-dependent methyltransferase
MLDVGCGSGHLLARHRDLGWSVAGIEPNRRAAEACRAQGLDVQVADLFHASLPAAHFDLIWLHHVIEHVKRPVEALERVRFALAPDGAVVLVTPNLRSLGFRLYGSCWYAIDAPRHLRLFDARTLAALARRAGLETAKFRSVPSARLLAMSRHYHRTQGPVLPAGIAARAAILERSREEDPDTRRFRRLVRPVSWAASRIGWGESLRAELVAAGAA